MKAVPIASAGVRSATLALLAALACAAPAAAQSLNAVDTLAYINERCDGYRVSDTTRRTQTGRISLTGTELLIQYRNEVYREAPRHNSDVAGSFDIRRVDFVTYEAGHTLYVNFRCGDADCVTLRVHQPGSRTGNVRSTEQRRSVRIACREPERVINAFKHLQQLLGGRIADPVDPFAN